MQPASGSDILKEGYNQLSHILINSVYGRMLAMSKEERKTKMVGPWRYIQVAIWLIGLAILAITGYWWPGILLVVAASVVYEALIRWLAPAAFVPEEPETPEVQRGSETPPAAAPATVPAVSASPPPIQEHRAELLPSECPKCGGPIRGQEVVWTGVQSADCPFCGVNLPMNKDSVSG
jgi:hypothetical protein